MEIADSCLMTQRLPKSPWVWDEAGKTQWSSVCSILPRHKGNMDGIEMFPQIHSSAGSAQGEGLCFPSGTSCLVRGGQWKGGLQPPLVVSPLPAVSLEWGWTPLLWGCGARIFLAGQSAFGFAPVKWKIRILPSLWTWRTGLSSHGDLPEE